MKIPNRRREKICTICRWVLGSIFLIFGLNGFYTFIPVPDFHPFMEILVESGYIYLIKSVEVTGGIMLLVNRFIPLSLSILAVEIVNITAFHVFLDPRNGFIAIILIVLWSVLFWGYKHYFHELLTMHTKPICEIPIDSMEDAIIGSII